MSAPEADELDRIIETIPENVVAICTRLREAGQRGWVVGGCVRDLLRGAPAKDWDIATDAEPKQVKRLFRRVIPTGIKHGTVTVLLHDVPYEVTTLRGEGAYVDGRRPADIVFLADIEQDLARRDFTFNAIAIDPIDHALIDPFGGRADLESRTLRAVGVPLERFCEDGLRVLRATRFAATLGCDIEDATFRAMRDERALATLKKVSAERVHDEWLKTMRAQKPSIAFDLLRGAGVMVLHCPELHNLSDAQWQRSMATLDATPRRAVLRIAALVHAVGSDAADGILRRLKFSNEDRTRVLALVENHPPDTNHSWTDAQVRRWLRRVTPPLVADQCALAIAEATARQDDAAAGALTQLQGRAEHWLSQQTPLESRDLAIGGKELMSELGMAPSKRVGDMLSALLELVLDDPSLNERHALLQKARSMLNGDAV